MILSSNDRMDTRYEIRRKNLRRLIDERSGGVDSHFAQKYDYTRSRIAQFLSPTYNDGKSIGDRAARLIEKKLGLEPLSLDIDKANQIPSIQWPFETSFDEFSRLTSKDIQEIEALIKAKLNNLPD